MTPGGELDRDPVNVSPNCVHINEVLLLWVAASCYFDAKSV